MSDQKATTMNRRERFAMAVNHQEPDRVPIDLGATGGGITEPAYRRLKERLDIKGDEGTLVSSLFIIDKFDERVLKALDTDFRHLVMRGPRRRPGKRTFEDGSFADEWGLIYKQAGHYMEMVNAPLGEATLAEIERYDWPDPTDPGRVEGLAEEARNLSEHTDYVIGLQSVGAVFQLCCRLRGMDRFLMEMMLDQALARRLMEITTDLTIGYYDAALTEIGPYVHVVQTQDDLGTQQAPFISPALYQELVQPFQAKLFAFIKQKTNGKAKVFLHSDGSIFDLLPHIIDAGVDIINPTQPQPVKMEPERLKAAYGDRITFHAGLDQQDVIPFGTVEEVKAEVRRKVSILAPGGGYIFAPCHNLQPDVPVENILAMYETAHEYGRYPIA